MIPELYVGVLHTPPKINNSSLKGIKKPPKKKQKQKE